MVEVAEPLRDYIQNMFVRLASMLVFWGLSLDGIGFLEREFM